MKPILERILTLFFVQSKPGTNENPGKLSVFQFARAYRLLRITVTRYDYAGRFIGNIWFAGLYSPQSFN
jgi:hypothetical protein